MKKSEIAQVEDCLYDWFYRNVQGIRQFLVKFLRKRHKFLQASEGWAYKFKKSFGIRLLSTTGEKFSSIENAVEPHTEKIQESYKKNGVKPTEYNADDSGLFWQFLQKKHLFSVMIVHHDEANAPG